MSHEFHQYTEIYSDKDIKRETAKAKRAIPKDAVSVLVLVEPITSIHGHENWRLVVQYEKPVF